jgi:hypothetical protein
MPGVRVQLVVREAPSASSGTPDEASMYCELSPTDENGLVRLVTGVAALTGVAEHNEGAICPVAPFAAITPIVAAAKTATMNTPGCRQPVVITLLVLSVLPDQRMIRFAPERRVPRMRYAPINPPKEASTTLEVRASSSLAA